MEHLKSENLNKTQHKNQLGDNLDPFLGITVLVVFALAIIGIIIYLLNQQKQKHAAMFGPAQPKGAQPKQPGQPAEPTQEMPAAPPTEAEEVKHFHKVEHMKEKARNKIFGSFTSAKAMKKSKQKKGKEAAMSSHKYKVRHVEKITRKPEHIQQQEHTQHKENISTIKGISHASPVSRLRKLFKTPDEKYLKQIVKEEEKEEELGEDSDSMRKLAGMSKEKSKAVTRLKFLRRPKD
jgi:hypothetical protein